MNIFLKNQKKNGITNTRIFGSVARKEDTDKRDLDIVVSVKKNLFTKSLRIKRKIARSLRN